jgi:hypothetical protein
MKGQKKKDGSKRLSAPTPAVSTAAMGISAAATTGIASTAAAGITTTTGISTTAAAGITTTTGISTTAAAISAATVIPTPAITVAATDEHTSVVRIGTAVVVIGARRIGICVRCDGCISVRNTNSNSDPYLCVGLGRRDKGEGNHQTE